MNNFKGEMFPANIDILLESSYQIVKELLSKLNSSGCPKLNDLYKPSNGKVYRKKTLFEDLKIEFNKGLYVFGEQKRDQIEPVYIGISRNIHTNPSSK